MLWVLKRTRDGSFDYPKHILKLMSKKILTIFTLKICVYLNLCSSEELLLVFINPCMHVKMGVIVWSGPIASY